MSKISTLLRSFSSREINHFNEFVNTSFINKRGDVKRLLNYWQKNRRKFSKEQAFTFVYDGKKFNSADWYLVNSRLFKLGEQFLATKELLEDTTSIQIFSMKAYRKKNLEHLFHLAIKDVMKYQEKQSLRNIGWLQNQFYFENEIYDYISSHNRKRRTNLQDVNDSLEKYFFANKLKTACAALARNTINQETYDIGLLEEVLQRIEHNTLLLEEPSINVYYYCYKAISDASSEQWFINLRKSMVLHQSCFHPSERRDILFVAINYCIKRLNTGSERFVREALELYQVGLSDGTLLEDGRLTESAFNNIFALALKIKEYDWAKVFINQYRKFLKPIFQDPLYYYSSGKLHFEQREFTESLQQLAKVETKTSFLFLGTKTIQLKIFYELQEMDMLDSVLESMRIYLQRHKDLGYSKSHFENLIYFVRKLLDKEMMSKPDKKQFIKDVTEAKILTEKEWLIKQIG